MGQCNTCAYFYETDNVIFNKYACKLFNRYVKATDTCEKYTPKPSGGKGCFLTSACVSYMGKEDDCEELTTLRNFRDTYMRSTESGRALIDEYYVAAPMIVKKIDGSENKDEHYEYIYSVIKKCLRLIGQGKNEETVNEYRDMVLTLKKQLC